MKLANQTLKYLAVSVLVVIALWSTIFYLFMLEVIHDNIDEELENQKRLIIQELASEAIVSPDLEFGINNYKVREISEQQAINMQNVYKDTMLYMQDDDDPEPELEPVRMLTTAFEHKGHYYELSIINSMIEESDLIKNLFYSVLILFVLLVVSIVSINKVVIERLWSPLYHFLDQLTKFRLGKSDDKPVMDTNIQEFKDLQFAVTTLIRHNEEIYEQQKQFIGNASHELQTPLAIAINKLDLLIEKESFPEDNLIDLSETKNGLIRLVNLNKSLLMLSRIENNQYTDKSEIEMNEVVKHVLEDFSDLLQFKNIDLDFSESTQFKTVINPDLAYILISNLIRNAVKYNSDGGKIIVTVDSYGVKIKNTSIGNEPLSELIFNRFYKAVNDNSSTGLGLSIVKSIAENHAALNILYSFENNFHVFSLKTKNS